MQKIKRGVRIVEAFELNIAQQILPLPQVVAQIQPAHVVSDLLPLRRVVGDLDRRSQNPAFVGQLTDQFRVLIQKKLVITIIGIQAGNTAVEWLAALAVEHPRRIGTSGEGETQIGW